MNDNPAFDINESTYQWCVRAFSFLQERLGVNIKVHDANNHIGKGQIFLFNHFARFETIIPQYIIYQATGAFCRCVAAEELFEGNEALSKFLWDVGAVPTDHPGLLSFLAAEILRGRKVIVFPEGGMIKDRRVMGDDGEYSIFSSADRKRRKHHKGAAAIALTLEIFKKRILLVNEDGDTARLQRWVDALGMDSIESLVAAARERTLVVPGNITFYPIRVDDNILSRGAELFNSKIGRGAMEELLIEGNILLKNTDMDIRFGRPIAPGITWNWWKRAVLSRVFERIHSLQDLFALKPDSDHWVDRMVSMTLAYQTRLLRDEYTREIYARVTVNLSHLASKLVLTLLDEGTMEIDRDRFHKLLYLAIKNVQGEPSVHLHGSTSRPEDYDGIHRGICHRFDQFLKTTTSSGLIEVTDDHYRFLPKLRQEHAFHEVRLENMVAVYANEVTPVAAVLRAVDQAISMEPATDKAAVARHLFDDEIRAFACSRETYSMLKHAEINDRETATESGAPYLLSPDMPKKTGVVLVHGFLSSPAELRDFGHTLETLGYPVLGVRLKGHGTSPWDLRDCKWEDWLDSVRRGHEIMSALADQVCLIGFSTGGALALKLAADQSLSLAGVASVSAPIKYCNRNLAFVPIIHGINTLTQWVSSLEGIVPFRENDSEHPDINYRHIPIRGLFELMQLTDELKRRLPDVTCPVRIYQGTEDPIVESESGKFIHDKVGSIDKSLHMIPSHRHGLLNENIGGVQEKIISFLASLSAAENHGPSAQPVRTRRGAYS